MVASSSEVAESNLELEWFGEPWPESELEPLNGEANCSLRCWTTSSIEAVTGDMSESSDTTSTSTSASSAKFSFLISFFNSTIVADGGAQQPVWVGLGPQQPPI